MKKLLIKNGTLITASETIKSDLLIEGEKISAIGDLHVPDTGVIDASGKLIMPGGLDPHVHLDLPMFGTVSSDDHYTGGKAAAFGGTTTVLDFIAQPDTGSFQISIEEWMQKAEKASIDYGFHMNVTRMDENVLKEIPSLVDQGITTLKMFTAYNGRLRLDDGNIFRVMRAAAEFGMLPMVHCENGDVIDILVEEALQAGHTTPVWHARTRPAWGAGDAVLRTAMLAKQADAPVYIVHLNTRVGLDQVRYARENGVKLMAETCPPYLFFTEEHLERPDGAKWICSPPMRSEEDNRALWTGLEDGSIQTMGTDHCPFFFDGTTPIEYEGEKIAIPGKELGKGDFTKIPNGTPGIGDRMPVLWTSGVVSGRITPNEFVALTSTNAARIFGLYPRKGSLMPGADADIVVWDPNKKVDYGVAVAQHRTDYNLYEGMKLQGFPELVFLRGKLIVEKQQWFGKRGMGQYQKRAPRAAIL
ncbi:MAG: dihydropyrimidinase [Anaerolineales bacterium]|nr:dihydropyrimidinase [Anaerolineales bacterium]